MSARSSSFDSLPDGAGLLAAIRRSACSRAIDLALVLGSGWGPAVCDAHCLDEFAYCEWGCFPPLALPGHAGRLQLLEWQGWRVLAFQGRWHCYQGLSAYEAALPARLAAALDIPRIVLTCATGGINPALRPGDFMLVRDHLNLLGDNPLRGSNPVFVDLSRLYHVDFHGALAAAMQSQSQAVHVGVLAAMPGPSYETPAEIAMLERCGADAVSMSTVPEAIMAHSLGLEVVALALVANPAAGRGVGAIDHADVLARGAQSATAANCLLKSLISAWQKVS